MTQDQRIGQLAITNLLIIITGLYSTLGMMIATDFNTLPFWKEAIPLWVALIVAFLRVIIFVVKETVDEKRRKDTV